MSKDSFVNVIKELSASVDSEVSVELQATHLKIRVNLSLCHLGNTGIFCINMNWNLHVPLDGFVNKRLQVGYMKSAKKFIKNPDMHWPTGRSTLLKMN